MWKKFKVYDGNDAEIWSQVEIFYKGIIGKDLKGKSRPSPRADGYYYCSTTKHVDKQRNTDIKNMEKQSWWSTFQLLPNRFTYARVFVGYDNLEDNSDYTIYVKYACLESSENTRVVLSKYGKKSSSSSSSSSDDISMSSSDNISVCSSESDIDV
jgi:hypothetical protein